MAPDALPEPLQATLAVFDAHRRGHPLSTSEVAEALETGRRGTFERLDKLVERGRLETKAVGARARVWWRPAPTDVEASDDDLDGALPATKVSFHRLVQAVEEYAIFLLTPGGRIASWNSGARRIKGYERDEIVGEPLTTFYTAGDVAAGRPERNLADAAEDGWVEDEGWRVRKDGSRFWADVTIAAVYDDAGELVGYTKVTKDLTERRRLERRLRLQRDALESELDDLFERIDEAFLALDDAGHITYVNDRAADLVGLSADDVLGEVLWDALPGLDTIAGLDVAEATAEREDAVEAEFHSERLDSWIEVRAYPSATGSSVYVRNVSARKEREQELERYEHIVEAVGDGIYVVDEDQRFEFVNDEYVAMVGYDREELLGSPVSIVLDDEGIEQARALRHQLRTGGATSGTTEVELVAADGTRLPVEARFARLDDDGFRGTVGVVRDVTTRRSRERELARFNRAVEASGHGIYMTDVDGRITYVNPAFEELTGYAEDQLVGETPELLRSGAHDDEYYRELWETILAGDVWEEEITDRRQSGERYYAEQTIAPVTDEDGEIDRFVAVQQDVTERKARELELERQRERLAVLNHLNTLFRTITDELLDLTTREAIERTVCASLAASDFYEVACIGEVDSTTTSLRHRADAGAEEALEPPTVAVRPEDAADQGPIGRAVETQELQVGQDLDEGAAAEAWHGVARRPDVRSAAAVPIVFEGSLYGVLCLYTGRDVAFLDEERRVARNLGEVVGHAIAAVERKRALLADEVIELTFRLADVDATLGLDGSTGRLAVTDTGVLGEDEFVVFGTATPPGMAFVRALVESQAHWRDLRVTTERDESVEFQARRVEPPVLSLVTSLGGRLDELVVEGGDVELTLHLVPGTDVRQVVAVVEEQYPAVEMVSRQQIPRPTSDAPELRRAGLDRLTDRQRAVLLAAHRGGFFEQPRANSGEEIADGLGISAATFHQHLRNAERKLAEAVLAT